MISLWMFVKGIFEMLFKIVWSETPSREHSDSKL